MSLRTKLFFTHSIVVLISIMLVGLMTTPIASFAYTEINEVNDQNIFTHDSQEALLNMIEEEVISADTAFSTSLLIGLGIAGGISLIIASVISYVLSKGLTTPISDMVIATQHIADGHYKQRVQTARTDEIGQLATQFNSMAQGLDEVEKTRRQLLEDVTHELSTPLTSIKGYVEGLQDGVMLADASTLALIHDETARLQRLIRDLQQLSSVESGHASLDLRPLSVRDVLQSVADKLAIQYQSKSVTLEVNYPSVEMMICADNDRMTQIFTNLLGNALQYTPSAGHVCVDVERVGHMVQFAIKDTGIGIKPADVKQIFQRFYRVDKSRNRRTGGSGIGLTIARYLIETHGGQIWAESAGVNQGSVFYFTIPMVLTLSTKAVSKI